MNVVPDTMPPLENATNASESEQPAANGAVAGFIAQWNEVSGTDHSDNDRDPAYIIIN